MGTINVHEAKMHLSRLLDRVQAGEEIVQSKAGKPCAKLVPLAPVQRRIGFMQGQLADRFFDPLAEDELRRWESD